MAKIRDLNELHRSSDSVIAGVAGGTAKFFDVDPVLIRVIFAVLIFAAGSGIVLYAGLWLFLPLEESEEPSIIAKLFNLTENEPQVRQVGIIVSLAFGALSLVSTFGIGEFDDFEIAWPLFWILFWASVLYWFFAVRPRNKQQALEDTQTDRQDSPDLGDSAAGKSEPGSVKPTKAPKEPNPLGGSQLTVLTLSVAAIALGVMIMISLWGLTTFTWPDYLGVALLIMGIGLLVGTIYGNGLGLIWIGLLIALNLGLNEAAFDSQSKQKTKPASITQLAYEYQFGAGDFVLDLSNIPAEDLLNKEIEVESGIGKLTVIIPKDVPVTAAASIGIGGVDLFGESQSGLDVELTYTSPGVMANRFYLDVESGIGQIEVVRK